jgi:pimeloyl-ACP methyl ester carboxylesterase
MFLDAGYDVAMMDYRTFGYSKGPLNQEILLSDALLWYDDLQHEKCPGQRIVVWGRSFGSGIAAHIAAERTPDLLVLETPYYSLEDCVRSNSRFASIIPAFLFSYQLPTYEYLAKVQCPVHLMHGENDEKIYFGSSEKLEQICIDHGITHRFWRVPGDNHNLRESNAERRPEFIMAIEAILGPSRLEEQKPR